LSCIPHILSMHTDPFQVYSVYEQIHSVFNQYNRIVPCIQRICTAIFRVKIFLIPHILHKDSLHMFSVYKRVHTFSAYVQIRSAYSASVPK
jgi:hypothetical protein